jgi:hypothetical protein
VAWEEKDRDEDSTRFNRSHCLAMPHVASVYLDIYVSSGYLCKPAGLRWHT